MRPPSKFPRMISSFKCSMECAPICSAGSSRTAFASAFTSLTARTGSPTSCAASPNAPPTLASSSAISSVPKLVAALQFPANGDAVAKRNQHGIQLLRSVDKPVELLDSLRIKVLRSCRPCRFSRPQGIVADEQAATAQLGERHAERVRVLVFVHVIEDEIELARSPSQEFMRVAYAYFNPLGHARPPKVIFCPARFLRIAIRINYLPFWPRRARQPDRRIPNRRPHLKNSFRTRDLHEQAKHSRHRRPNDGYSILRRVIFYFRHDGIAFRQQAVKVFLDIVLNKPAAQILAANHGFSPGFMARNPVFGSRK